MYQVGDLIAEYRVTELLGSGGMGEVYKAAHPRLPRTDALKVLRSELAADPVFRTRFEREADLVAPIKHPNLVSIFDRGIFDGQLWIAMEFVPGTDAGDLLEKGPVAPNLVVDIIRGAAAGLGTAHQHGVLHRDIKPANIMVTLSKDGSRVEECKLTDFGIAQALDEVSKLTGTGNTIGTMLYASPEQVAAERVDSRGDVYSLGATAFELLTGTPPFNSNSMATLMSAHIHEPPPAASTRNPTLPTTVDDVLKRAMAKKPDARHQTPEAFATDLANALQGHTAPSAPVAPTPSSPGWIRPQSTAGTAGGPYPSGPYPSGPSGPYPSAPYPSGPYPSGQQSAGPYSGPTQQFGGQQFSGPQFSGQQPQTGAPTFHGGPNGPPTFAGPGPQQFSTAAATFTPPKPAYKKVAILGAVIVLVAALVGVGIGALSRAFSGLDTPNAPQATATAEGVELSWDAVDGATSYVVKQGDSEIYTGSETTYTIPGPLPGTYTYTVAARDDSSTSEFSGASEELSVWRDWGEIQELADIFPGLFPSSPNHTDGYDELECSGELGIFPVGPHTQRISCEKKNDDEVVYEMIVNLYADANEARVATRPVGRLRERPFTSAQGTTGSEVVNDFSREGGFVILRFDADAGDKSRAAILVQVPGNNPRATMERAAEIARELPL